MVQSATFDQDNHIINHNDYHNHMINIYNNLSLQVAKIVSGVIRQPELSFYKVNNEQSTCLGRLADV